MKKLIFFIAILCWSTCAHAQAAVFDIAKAKLIYTWTQGTGGMVTQFNARCGISTGSYNILVVFTDPALRSMPINKIITVPGKYFCVVSAANLAGESAYSNEVSFDVGVVPGAPASLIIQAN